MLLVLLGISISFSPELTLPQEKLNESVVVMNKTLQDINIQNMNIELVAQMFKNYQSNVLFHLEGMFTRHFALGLSLICFQQRTA